MRKALLYHLLQRTLNLPTDCKENLFKGSYNCFHLKDINAQKQKGRCVGGKKGKVGIKPQLRTNISSHTGHSNTQTRVFFNFNFPKAFGLKSCIPLVVPCKTCTNQTEVSYWRADPFYILLWDTPMSKIFLTRICLFVQSFQYFCCIMCHNHSFFFSSIDG